MLKQIVGLFSLLIFCVQMHAQKEPACGFDHSFFSKSYEQWYMDAVEYANAEPSSKRDAFENDTSFVIPIVFHFIYPNGKEVDYNELLSKVKQMNDDFSFLNSDTDKVRKIFRSRVGDTKIRFVLANQTPNGDPSLGYTFKRSNKTYGQNPGQPFSKWHPMKFDSLDGTNAWDTRKYMNIWVCDMKAPNGGTYSAGFATPPKNAQYWDTMYFADSCIDGIVLSFWGYNGTVRSGTATHEIGHYLGLRHVSGDPPPINNDSIGCALDDFIYDTPRTSKQNYYICDPTRNSCIEDSADMPDMLENYMDYTGDGCRASFTVGQARLMRYTLYTLRSELYQTKINSYFKSQNSQIVISPNPVQNELFIRIEDSSLLNLQYEFIDALGRVLESGIIENMTTVISFESYSSSVYFIRFSNGVIRKIIKMNN